MIKMQCSLFFISSSWETWARARHQRLLQFPSHAQIRFHLLVLRQNFAIALFQIANVGQKKGVLHFEQRLRGNKSKKPAAFVDQYYVVVKILLGARKYDS